MLQITFLGTGTSSGVPMVACHCEVCKSKNKKDKRLRPSVYIQSPQTKIVIDTGPDFRTQMLREKIMHLDAVLLTHSHKDHLAGLDDIRAYNYITNKAMDVYANKDTIKVIYNDFGYSFAKNKYPGVPEMKVHEIGANQKFWVGDLEVITIHVKHYQMPVLGYRIGDFTYITDANYVSNTEKKKIKGTKVLVVNALRKEKHISHFTLEEAKAFAREIQPEQVYFTHISHQMGLHDEVDENLPNGKNIAYDGLKITI